MRDKGIEMTEPIWVALTVAAGVLVLGVLLRRARRGLEARIEARLRKGFSSELEAAESRVERTRAAFIEAVSHDLRTPLASILGFALTLEHRWDELEPDRAREYVERVAWSARRLDHLLADLVDVRRLWLGLVEARVRPVDVGFLVRDVAAHTSPEGRTIHAEADEVRIVVDPGMFERTVEIMLANAIKHTPERTGIWVTVQAAGEGAVLSVRDEGPGVPEEFENEIFEPFAQVDPRVDAPGMGVGLALVAGYAVLHEGRAWVENNPGGGATFKVLFPGTVPQRARLDAPIGLIPESE